LPDGSDLDDSDRLAELSCDTATPSPVSENGNGLTRVSTHQIRASMAISADFGMSDPTVDIVNFAPTEFKSMSRDDKIQIFNMLSWASIKSWDFNIFELNKISGGKPLLFMGWAILGSPYAQSAMANDIGLDYEAECEGYPFMDELLIPPTNLCEYLRVIESDYHAANPYHNAIHAADVLQSLHCLIQHSLNEEFLKDCPNIKLFTILFSAAIHDVDHPGKTNAFYTSLRSKLAVMYNDRSVLENWHVAHAFARMLNLELGGSKSIHFSEVISAKRGNSIRDCDTNILCNASPEQFKTIRDLAIEAVLHTDMTKHFEMVNAAKGLLRQDVTQENTWKLLMYMLHMADISGQAKRGPLFKLWTMRCMDEFFAQGDEETKLGMPISPNCDRKTTKPSESQVGFIKYVVEPAYEVMAMFIPFVESYVLPIINSNHNHWVHQMDLALVVEEGMNDEETPNGDDAPRSGSSVDV
jgi:3',5'-cyclic-nucleotide phosphodiesterase